MIMSLYVVVPDLIDVIQTETISKTESSRIWLACKRRVSRLVTDTSVFSASLLLVLIILSETEGDARGNVMLSDHVCFVQRVQSQTQSTLFPIFVPTFVFPLKHRLHFWSVSDIKRPLINMCTEALGWDGQYFPSSVQTQARGFIKVCRGSIYNCRTVIREPRDPSRRTCLDLTLLHFRPDWILRLQITEDHQEDK